MKKSSKTISGLVSVVMPAYMCANFIKYSIQSVINQTYKNIELIIVIDGCADKTKDIVNDYKLIDNRIKIIEHKVNLGISAARNTGICNSKGQYIAFCDSDDTWRKDKLENQISLIKTSGQFMSHSSADVIDSNGYKIGYRSMPVTIDKNNIRRRNYIVNSSAVIDRNAYKEIYFNDIKHEDYDLWLRLIKDHKSSIGLDVPLVRYRSHGNNFTSNKYKSILWMIKVQLSNGIKIHEIFLNLFINAYSRINFKQR